SYDHNVYALNESTGGEIWNYSTGSSIYSSPAVADGMVFIGSLDNNTYALNERTGSKIWNYSTGNQILSSPAVADGMVFIGSYDHNVYALNESTGGEIWNYTTSSSLEGSPAVADGMVFIGSYDHNIYTFSSITPIIINIINPLNNIYSNLTSQTFTFNYSSSVSSTANCSLFINGALNQSNSTTYNNTNTNFIVNGFSDGVYNWSVGCSDSYKNYNNSGNQTLTIITTPPLVNVVEPVNNTYNNSGSVTVVFNYTSSLSQTANCSFFVFEYGAWQLLENNATTLNNTNTTIFSSSNIAPAVYPWMVNCTDLAGNENSTGTYIFNEIFMNVSLVSPANNSLLKYTQPFEFNVTGANSTYDCNLYLNNTPYGEDSAVLNNTNTNITANQTLQNGLYLWYVNCSSSGFSEVSQIFNLNFSGIVHNLNLIQIIPNPIGTFYRPPNNNVSFSLKVFNSGNVIDDASNAQINTSNGGVFTCPSPVIVQPESYATITCTGNVIINVSLVTVNASISPVLGESNGVYNQTISLTSLASINSSGIVVPDSNLLIILSFAFISFFLLNNSKHKK
ncbi:MAG: PQQ-binding-like beta-propeller repeat protein, partial [Candidatus Marsarchaeota archaeon]|nr:PQQ-binding-like beta-propeller repeat protein [Candidatus Marsarchaeota archaeon]